VVLITIDTLRADRLGCYGYSKNLTPNLDRIARNGVLFENAVAPAPSTPPSHASMFTGTYPTVHGVRNAGGFSLDKSHLTLAEILREKGWQTAAFVGASVLDRIYGLNQGFDVYDDRMPVSNPGAARDEEPSRRAAQVVDRAIGWLQEQSGQKPFFLWVHIYDPHAPHKPPPPFQKRYRNSPYDGEVAYTDQELGRLCNAIEMRSPAEKTLMAVLADHGESLTEHGEYYHGVFLYDSTLRIPWIMTGPGIPADRRVKSQARTIDLLPTLMNLLGGDTPQACQGVSLGPALTGQPIETTYSYAEALYPKLNMGWAELRALRTSRWKYIRAPRPELYDLESDPGETTNVINQHPAELQKMKEELERIASIGGPNAPEKVQVKTVSAATERQLESLGYVSAGAPKLLSLTGQGIDPKDRIHILKLLEESGSRRKSITAAERIRLLDQARKEDPTNPVLYYLLGQAYENSQPDRALEIYRAALAQKVTATSKIYARMGIIYGEQGRLDEAISAFEKALGLDPTDLESHDKLALAYLLKGKVAEAERILKFLLSVDDENSQAHNNMGWIALKKGDARAARAHFERALQLDPNLLEAYLNLASLYKEAGDYARARANFEKYLERASAEKDFETIEKVRKELAAVIELQKGRR
jgi:arylsulfatase A-like enzyme/Flp pilus assembly protein TadD